GGPVGTGVKAVAVHPAPRWAQTKTAARQTGPSLCLAPLPLRTWPARACGATLSGTPPPPPSAVHTDGSARRVLHPCSALNGESPRSKAVATYEAAVPPAEN